MGKLIALLNLTFNDSLEIGKVFFFFEMSIKIPH